MNMINTTTPRHENAYLRLVDGSDYDQKRVDENDKILLSPSKSEVQTFFFVLFGYCDGLIACRSFAEKACSNYSKISPRNIWITTDEMIAINGYEFAKSANNAQTGCYVIPGTVAASGQARSSDIMQMQTLLIDIDDGNTEEKLQLLSKTIGEPTLIVESGGITSCGNKKLHIYWQLVKAVQGEDLQQLLHLRYKIALYAGGDLHFKSAHQPIRVAGSIYHKNADHKLVKIRSYYPIEYELNELTESIEALSNQMASTLHNANQFNTSYSSSSSSSFSPTLPIKQILTDKVYAGGNGEQTRFNHLSKVTGYWIRRYHDGLITKEQAIDEITSYNIANVSPPWPEDKLTQMINGIWNTHLEKYENSKPRSIIKPKNSISSFSLDIFLNDKGQTPPDIIAPRILTPGGLMVFGGAPKVGKSDFLLSLFTHLAAGEEFLGFKPPKALKIFYFQAEIGYHYLRERLQNMHLSHKLVEAAKSNLHITPNTRWILDEDSISAIAKHTAAIFPKKPDIIAIDPIRNVFDGGRVGATENDNDAMLFFLTRRIELLRDMINPDAGIILVHHTKKITNKQFDEEPFSAFSGASSLRGYYTSGAILRRSDTNPSERELIFELRNGSDIPAKILTKKNNKWKEENQSSRRIARKNSGIIFDCERQRRIAMIITLLEKQALKGKFYLMKQFAQKYQNHEELGGKRSIYDDCSVAATKGLIKFFDNPTKYNQQLINPQKGFGFICTEKMKIKVTNSTDLQTGEVSTNYIRILPTHYKCDCDGRKKIMTNPNNWDVELDEMEDENAE